MVHTVLPPQRLLVAVLGIPYAFLGQNGKYQLIFRIITAVYLASAFVSARSILQHPWIHLGITLVVSGVFFGITFLGKPIPVLMSCLVGGRTLFDYIYSWVPLPSGHGSFTNSFLPMLALRVAGLLLGSLGFYFVQTYFVLFSTAFSGSISAGILIFNLATYLSWFGDLQSPSFPRLVTQLILVCAAVVCQVLLKNHEIEGSRKSVPSVI